MASTPKSFLLFPPHSQDQAVLWRLINKRKRSHGDIVIEVCHSEPGAWKPASFSTSPCPLFSSRHSYHIGRTMFETDRLPEGWLKKLDSMDEVWVPSTFMKNIFEEGGATNVHVIGESVDTVFFRPIESLRLHATLSPSTDTANSFHVSRKTLIADTFELHPKFAEKNNVFLSIFKWEMRKGWDILLDVFFHTFSINDPVSLIIITQEYHETRILPHPLLFRIHHRPGQPVHSPVLLCLPANTASSLLHPHTIRPRDLSPLHIQPRTASCEATRRRRRSCCPRAAKGGVVLRKRQ